MIDSNRSLKSGSLSGNFSSALPNRESWALPPRHSSKQKKDSKQNFKCGSNALRERCIENGTLVED